MARLRDSEFLPPIVGQQRQEVNGGSGENMEMGENLQKIRSLRTDKCVCGKASVDSVGHVVEILIASYCYAKQKLTLKRRRNRKMQWNKTPPSVSRNLKIWSHYNDVIDK